MKRLKFSANSFSLLIQRSVRYLLPSFGKCLHVIENKQPVRNSSVPFWEDARAQVKNGLPSLPGFQRSCAFFGNKELKACSEMAEIRRQMGLGHRRETLFRNRWAHRQWASVCGFQSGGGGDDGVPAQGRRQREAREAPFFRRQDGRGRIRALSSFSADYLIMVGGGVGEDWLIFRKRR